MSDITALFLIFVVSLTVGLTIGVFAYHQIHQKL